MLVRSANINIMMKAAGQAGRVLTRDFNEVEHLQVTRKGPADFVSAADRKAEEIIHDSLAKARPDYGFLMEEGGSLPGTDKNRRFIIDPLDGTTNFLHGLPHFSISIALEEEGIITAGVVYDPIKDEYFWADRHKGAYLGIKRLHVANRRHLADSLFATGIPFLGSDNGSGFHARYAQEMVRVAGVSSGIRRWGSAALDLCYVAAGRVDGFWEHNLKPWDVAAGALIAWEAGAVITQISGAEWDLTSPNLITANTYLHPPFQALVEGKPPNQK